MDIKSKLGMLLGSNKTVKTSNPSKFADQLGGREETNSSGSFLLIETFYPIDHIHGKIPLSSCNSQVSSLLNLSGSGTHPFCFDSFLFLDTETTGLAGGTGTYAFLIGTGRFEKDRFVVRQYLMRDYHEELAMLESFTELLSSSKLLVTFNGKSFDWPLIQTRFTLARMDIPGPEEMPHLDLLHLARRMWKNRFDHFNLSYLEERLLRIYRENDIPGYLIPQRYFDFLRTQRGDLLKDILKHNASDILSLVGLLSILQKKTEQKPQEIDCPFEAEAMARLCLKKQQKNEALQYLSQAHVLSNGKEQKIRTLHQMGYCYKSLGQFRLAESTWLDLLDIQEDYLACEELAKLYEHKFKDLHAALKYARRGLAQAIARRINPQVVERFEYRIARLESKMVKTREIEELTGTM
jgi:uncharacterized protein YprB with RNaseH-like and TPR domain